MTKLDAGLITSLPASDPGSAAVWGSKRINPRPQFCLCLAWSGCPSNDDDLLFQVEMYFSEDSSIKIDNDAKNADTDAKYAPSTSLEFYFLTKKELDDLIRDLGLTKSGVELLRSRLNEWNQLGDDCKSTAYRNRHLEFSVYFDVIEDLCYCKDVEGFFSAFGIDHDPIQWRLFIDSSTTSLKAVLLYNGNIQGGP